MSLTGSAPHDRGWFGLVLLLVLASYTLAASGADGGIPSLLLFGMQAAVLWLVLGETGSAKTRNLFGVVLGMIGAVTLITLVLVGTSDDASVAAAAYAALLYLIAPLAILRRLATRQFIDVQTLLATIATYVMIGMFFAYGFELVALLQDGPFFGESGDGTRSEYLFFSFTTLLTVGYGNLVPATNPGQTMAMMEAMAGQLFLIIAVARVVTLLGRPREPLRAQRDEGSST